jgi:coenzyme Q-binding protein COQ10
MPQLTISEPSPYSPAQLYALVIDIACYPDFLPWCKAARIKSQSEHEIIAELVILFKGLTERYTSRVTLNPVEYQVDVEMIEGPFHYLTNQWRLVPLPEGGTEIQLALDFRFKSRVLEKIIGGIFERASLKMVEAFRNRADALYK